MKRILILALFVICLTDLFAQTAAIKKNNAISFEIGKTGLFYNLNFDHRFNKQHFGIRAVMGSTFTRYLNGLSFGGGGYYLIGHTKSFLELGADVQYIIINETSDDQRGLILFWPDYPVRTIYPSINIGFRRYGRKIIFRTGISPGILENGLLIGGYGSLGFLF